MNSVLSDLKECQILEITSGRGRGRVYNNYTASTSFEMTSIELNIAPNAR